MSEPTRPMPGPPELPTAAPLRSERLLKRFLGVIIAIAVVAVLAIASAVSFKEGKDHASSQSGQLYSQVASAGVTPVVTPPGASPAKVIPGPTGASGPAGSQGRGIVASKIVSGHLLLTYSDGTAVNVGQITGPAGSGGKSGSPGAVGKDGSGGRGIASTAVTATGRLTVTYTDGKTSDLGSVVGPTGTNGSNGSAGADGKNGVDGKNGSDGMNGVAGSPPASFTFTIPGVLGDTTYDCTPNGTGGPGSQPDYGCVLEPTSSPTP